MQTLNRYKQNLHLNGNKVISYVTHVATINYANNTLIRLNWQVAGRSSSPTTSKHISYVANQFNLTIVDEEEDKPKKDNSLGLMKAFLILGDITNDKDTLKAKVEYKERIVFATMRANIPDWQKPNDWDSLPIDEKMSRLNRM